jgi:hypothetical protein
LCPEHDGEFHHEKGQTGPGHTKKTGQKLPAAAHAQALKSQRHDVDARARQNAEDRQTWRYQKEVQPSYASREEKTKKEEKPKKAHESALDAARSAFQRAKGLPQEAALRAGFKAFQTVANAGRAPPARKLHEGELHYGNHSFTGPGTRLDLPEVRKHAPVNNVDACSRAHDIAYEQANQEPDRVKRAQIIRQADRDAVQCYAQHKGDDGYLAATAGIQGKMAAENHIPFSNVFFFGYAGAD